MTTGEETTGSAARSARVLPFAVVFLVALAGLVLALSAARGSGGGPGVDARAVPPLDLATVPAPMAAHYRFARAHLTAYSQIPCFCGCEKFLGHRHLGDCFVRADGRGWEAHASGCSVCSSEATIAERLIRQGRSAAEVRDEIVARFGTIPGTAPASIAPSKDLS